MSNPETDFYNDAEFSGFISSLNAEMKRLQSKGIGSTQKQAEPSPQEEELLREKKSSVTSTTNYNYYYEWVMLHTQKWR